MSKTKQTVLTLAEKKQKGEKISQITCYDYTFAGLVDQTDIDMILVGDSLGMTMMGYSDTLPVTVNDMITYGRSVVNGAKNTMVIVDMPFMSYQISPQQALENAGRIMKETGADGVKLEGGVSVAPMIEAITRAGIPVVGHIGMTPQSVNAMGGFKVQGKDEENAKRVLRDALAVQEAGAFAVTLECLPPKLSTLITNKLDIITIGIGASVECDGQVLVLQDMLGLNEKSPKFVKQYEALAGTVKNALQSYADEVREKAFPEEQHSYGKSDCSDEFLKELEDNILA